MCKDNGNGDAVEIGKKEALIVNCGATAAGHPFVWKDSSLDARFCKDERNLLMNLYDRIVYYDPDVLTCWDTIDHGLGYIIKRGESLKPPLDMVRMLGRTPRLKVVKKDMFGNEVEEEEKEKDSFEDKKKEDTGNWEERVGPGESSALITGRLVICGWRIMTHEVKHPMVSSIHAVASVVLQKTVPDFSDVVLKTWFNNYKRGGINEASKTIKHVLMMAEVNVQLLDRCDVIGRAGEAARLSGVELSASLPGARGSQYFVEGVLANALGRIVGNEVGRTGHTGATMSAGGDTQGSASQTPGALAGRSFPDGPFCAGVPRMGFLFQSPTKSQLTDLEGLESIPLVKEPKSEIYHDPVVVCDFTALYPSLIIAYNLCYSTIFGKFVYKSTLNAEDSETSGRIGMEVYDQDRTAAFIDALMPSCKSADNSAGKGKDKAYVIPSGSLFIGEDEKKGVLPQVLAEILETRAMLKRTMKVYKGRKGVQKGLFRSLEAKQLALKMVANVTYGYTSATFSGRCACPLVADAIVELARRTLGDVFELADSWGADESGRWRGAKVVYGDTDSVFVKLPGRSVREAFEFGEQFCKAVNDMNPNPVNLKLEKVYGACMLQTKKRYCGMMYTSRDQAKGVFEAKGIEVIRKDNCALTQRVQKGALMTLFKTGSRDRLKEYLQRQWTKILSGSLPLSQFVLSGRVREQYRNGGSTNAAELVKRICTIDPGFKMKHSERISYVIVATPGVKYTLRECVRTPMELLENWDVECIHTTYYAKRQLNMALDRCFSLPPYNIDVHAWFDETPKPRQRANFWPMKSAQRTIISWFGNGVCTYCGEKCTNSTGSKVVICKKCLDDEGTKQRGSLWAIERMKEAGRLRDELRKRCEACNGCGGSGGEMNFGAVNTDKGLGVVVPIGNCLNLECDVFFKRHRGREMEIEAEEVVKGFGLLEI
jgi:DNA polymerase zeta